MFTRKALVLFVLGIISLGFVLADDPKPMPTPQPAPPPVSTVVPTQAVQPVMPAAPAQGVKPQPIPVLHLPPRPGEPVPPPMRKRPFKVAEPEPIGPQLEQLAKKLKPSEKKVFMEMATVEMESGFIAESGLTTGVPSEKSSLLVTCVTRREVKLLDALIRASALTGRVQLAARPSLIIGDGQTGYCQGGVNIPYETDGKVVFMSSPITGNLGYSLKITPEISKDNRFVHLKMELQSARVESSESVLVEAGTPPIALEPATQTQTALPKESPGVQTSPTMASETASTTLILPSGGTVVIGRISESGSKTTEYLWVVTPHVVCGK